MKLMSLVLDPYPTITTTSVVKKQMTARERELARVMRIDVGIGCRGVRLRGKLSVSDPEVGPTRISRKEVIQPQVPLRLPCYDFAPVTALAFGRLVWLPSSGADFGRSQLPWRDGRCVQGPGTYSPWRS